MKKVFILLMLIALPVIASAQAKKVSILGDSYSTFQGHNPEGYAPFYPNDRNDVTEVAQTWWSLYIKAMGYELEQNNSWGGTTICNTGYGHRDVTASSFNARAGMLGNPDIIFLFGGTNDAWANSPIGEYKYADWTDEDCKAFRPALACLLNKLRTLYPKAEIYSILNSELKEEINESSRKICKHYNVQLIELVDIEKQNGHPSIKGMQAICNQLMKAVKPGYKQIDIPAKEKMAFNINDFKWTREPKSCVIENGTIEVTTNPHTDLWQRTYYHFRNDNAPVFQMKTKEKFFSFIVKTDFTESHHRFDQCGVVMYLDSENWLKGSIEYENEQFQHLGSVATNHGYSDWATTAIPADVKSMWYRLSRREDDFCIECSADGKEWSQMRVCHMYEAKDEVSFGIYACSPEDSSFKAVFTNMQLTECAWKAHDGQQPDEK